VASVHDYRGAHGEGTQVASVNRRRGEPRDGCKLRSDVPGERAVDVKFCLVFPREALSVPVTRHVLGDALRSLGADDQAVGDLLLAVTEACTNVVRHGGPGHRYEVVASVGRGGCRVEVLNAGRGFHAGRLTGARLRRPGWAGTAPRVPRPRRQAAPGRTLLWAGRPAGSEAAVSDEAIAALPETGRGLAIMRACVDDVTLTSRPEHGTVVSLRKRIAWRSGAPLAQFPADQFADAG
jgi:serine/threonine-protein kinase RsbW